MILMENPPRQHRRKRRFAKAKKRLRTMRFNKMKTLHRWSGGPGRSAFAGQFARAPYGHPITATKGKRGHRWSIHRAKTSGRFSSRGTIREGTFVNPQSGPKVSGAGGGIIKALLPATGGYFGTGLVAGLLRDHVLPASMGNGWKNALVHGGTAFVLGMATGKISKNKGLGKAVMYGGFANAVISYFDDQKKFNAIMAGAKPAAPKAPGMAGYNSHHNNYATNRQ